MCKPLLFCLLFLYLTFPVFGQECEWLATSNATGYQEGGLLAVDDSNNVIMVGFCLDAFTLGSHSFTTTSPHSRTYIIKYDPDGNILASWQPSYTFAFLNINTIETDKDNNIYVSGSGRGNISLGNGKTMSSTTTFPAMENFIIKFNSKLEAQWSQCFGVRPDFQVIYPNFYMPHLEVSVDSNSNVLIAFPYQLTTYFPGVTDSLTNPDPTGQQIGLVKFDSNGYFQWARGYGNRKVEYLMDMDCDAEGNSYLLILNDSTFIAGPDTLQGSGEVIMKVSPTGVTLKGIINKASQYRPRHDGIRPVGISVSHNGCFAITGTFTDTAFFQGTRMISTGPVVPINQRYNNYIAYYNSNLKLRWIKKENPVNVENPCWPNGRVSIKNNFIFFGGVISGDSYFGSLFLDYTAQAGDMLYIVKADTLGNFLWGFCGGKYVLWRGSIDADLDGNCYFTGSFADSIQIFDKVAKTGGGWDFYLAKIKDYRITRGNVYPGPYCAGDSISIPYSKYGNYKTGNYFYAELSDEDGNFDGNHRELGRLKSDSDGVIKGILPLFDVASSASYRIRVRATHPQVQSFYKKDTLRLLVYSRDSAHAGPDHTICRGEDVTLSTFGGTKWQWTPAGLQNDSTQRKLKVAPLATTEYRIAISDSSGCGVTDTDYVSVYVRPPLAVHSRGDTTICKGQTVKLYASGTGGDSLHYYFNWDHGIGAANSSLVSPDSTTTYKVVLRDSCSAANDSAFITITVRAALEVIPRTDTIICKGQQLNLFANGSGGDSTTYIYSWDHGIGNGQNKLISPDSSTTYRLIFTDNCMPEIDTAYVSISVRPALSITSRTDTIICKGQSVTLFAFASGGDSLNHKYEWDHGIGTANYVSIIPDSTTIYQAVLSDNCTVAPDTAFVKITVRPPLTVSLNSDSSICRGQSMFLSAFATGGDGSYRFLWDNGDTLSNQTVSPNITTTYRLVTTDDCTIKSDSSFVKVTVRPDLKITPRSDTTICRGQSVLLFASASGGDSSAYTFSWDNNLGNSSYAIVNPLQTTTYKIILNDNCSDAEDSGFVTVSVRQPLQILPMPDTTICTGQSVPLFSNASGGDSMRYKFSWDQGVGDTNYVSLNPVLTTIYRVILSDNCSSEQDTGFVKITVRQPLDLSMPPDTTICRGQSFSFAVFGSGGDTANHIFTWGNNQGSGQSKTVRPLYSTTYRVILSDNCTLLQDTSGITVNVRDSLNVDIDPDTSLCYGQTITLHAFAYGGDSTSHKLTWSPVTGSGPSIIVTPLMTTTYKVVLSDNCTVENDSAEMIVTVSDPLVVIATPATVNICEGKTIQLSASGSGGDPSKHIYTWDHGLGNGKDQQLAAAVPGKYVVALTDGCSLPAYDTVDVNIDALPKPDFVSSDSVGCEPLEVEFKSIIPYPPGSTAIWNFGDGSTSISIDTRHQYMQSGMYSVQLRLTTPAGCVDSVFKPGLVLVHPTPIADFVAEPHTAKINSPFINLINKTLNADLYNWLFGDGFSFSSDNKAPLSHTYPDTGNYIVTLEATNIFGCIAEKTDTIRIEEDFRFYIPNSFTPNGDGLNDDFTPTALFTENYELSIYNRWGEKIYHTSEGKPWNGMNSSGEVIPGGTYMYRYKTTDKSGSDHYSSGMVTLLR